MKSVKQRRNDPCACGSGKKFKRCCEEKLPHKDDKPTPAEIAQLLGLYNTGRYAELENMARSLLERYPNAGFAWKLLGGALQKQGKEALTAVKKAAELRPEDAEAHFNLGVVQKNLGHLNDAVASYRRALDIKPDFAEAHCNLGVVFKDLGQLDDALASYRRALQLQPDSPEAHNNLGVTLKMLGQLDQAEASYREALQYKPEYAEAYSNLGNVLKRVGRFAEALTCFRQAIAIWPDFSRAYANMGVALHDLQQFEAAAENYRRALQVDPRCYEAMIGLGTMHLENGEPAEAKALLLQALEISPDNIEARFDLTLIDTVQAGDENFAALLAAETAVQNGQLRLPDNGIYLNFALGKCFDDCGDYNRAFQHFLQGSQLKRATLSYNAAQTTQYVSDIIRIFDRETIERLRGGGNPSQLPIFVLGLPRSGTTLIEQIIATHPMVYGAGELPILQAITQRKVNGGGETFPHNIPALKQADMARWAEGYVNELQRYAPNSSRITDKLPDNFFSIGLLTAMLPNAKIIHVKRNPVDTCLSSYTQLYTGHHEYTYDLAELGQYYADYARLMEHWRSVLPAGAFIEVQYEDVVADLEVQRRRLLDYCGLDWKQGSVDFYKNKRPIHTASMAKVRQPIYQSSVARWRHYEKFLGPLLDALGNLTLGLCLFTTYRTFSEMFGA